MSSYETTASTALVQLTRLASEARVLRALVCTQHDLRVAFRHVLVTKQWSQLDEARREFAGSPALAARFDEGLLGVLESPELGALEAGARWHGLVLAIPVSLTSRSGSLVSLPHAIASTLRDSLQGRFPAGTGLRLINRPVPQFAAHAMGARSLYELVEELASGVRGAPGASGSQPVSEFVPEGRSLGRHYFFALALTTHPEQLALELPGALQADPGLVKWAATQTEKITSDFAERGWPILMRVFPPMRLREMLSSPPVLGDVRELDGMVEQAVAQHGAPVSTLRADLAFAHGNEGGLRIAISDRKAGTPLVHGLYRLAALGAEAGAYRAAVRLASAGVELVAADENLRGAVERATTLTKAPPPSETPPPDEMAKSRRFGAKGLRSRFSRPSRPST